MPSKHCENRTSASEPPKLPSVTSSWTSRVDSSSRATRSDSRPASPVPSIDIVPSTNTTNAPAWSSSSPSPRGRSQLLPDDPPPADVVAPPCAAPASATADANTNHPRCLTSPPPLDPASLRTREGDRNTRHPRCPVTRRIQARIRSEQLQRPVQRLRWRYGQLALDKRCGDDGGCQQGSPDVDLDLPAHVHRRWHEIRGRCRGRASASNCPRSRCRRSSPSARIGQSARGGRRPATARPTR